MAKISERLNRVLSPTGNLMGFLGKVADFLLVGILWFVCSIPVVTIGAATAALYTVSFRLLSDECDGIVKEFFQGFRENWRLASFVWLLLALLGGFLVMDLYFYLLWSSAGAALGTVLFSVFVAVTVLYLVVSPWLLPYISQFDCTFLTALRNSAYLSLRHIGYTLVMLAWLAGLLALSLFFPVVLLALPGAVAFIDSWCLNRVFSRYRQPQAAEDTETAT